MALGQLVDDVLDKSEELDSTLIDVKALETQHAILLAAAGQLLRATRDAAAIESMKDVLKALAKRKVTTARVDALHQSARDLQGKLAARTAAKGAGKGATKELRDAILQQREVWSACYRILAQLGQADERVRSLLAAAAA